MPLREWRAVYQRPASPWPAPYWTLETHIAVRAADAAAARELAEVAFEQVYGIAPSKLGFTLRSVTMKEGAAM